jgi:hypothetical protein
MVQRSETTQSAGTTKAASLVRGGEVVPKTVRFDAMNVWWECVLDTEPVLKTETHSFRRLGAAAYCKRNW